MRKTDTQRILEVVAALRKQFPREQVMFGGDRANGLPDQAVILWAFGNALLGMTWVIAWPARKEWRSMLIIFDKEGEIQERLDTGVRILSDREAPAAIVRIGLDRLRYIRPRYTIVDPPDQAEIWRGIGEIEFEPYQRNLERALVSLKG